MKTANTKQVLSNLYGLMMEINFHRSHDEVLEELNNISDSNIDAHLVKIKRLSMKLKAVENQVRFKKVIDQFALLKSKGLDELKKLFGPEEEQQLVPLFRKFEELTKEDEQSIVEDQELLRLLDVLKDKLDESN